jgi:hypothetical protein
LWSERKSRRAARADHRELVRDAALGAEGAPRVTISITWVGPPGRAVSAAIGARSVKRFGRILDVLRTSCTALD